MKYFIFIIMLFAFTINGFSEDYSRSVIVGVNYKENMESITDTDGVSFGFGLFLEQSFNSYFSGILAIGPGTPILELGVKIFTNKMNRGPYFAVLGAINYNKIEVGEDEIEIFKYNAMIGIGMNYIILDRIILDMCMTTSIDSLVNSNSYLIKLGVGYKL